MRMLEKLFNVLLNAVVHVLAAAIESAQIGGSVEIQDRQREELKNVSNALATEMDLSMIFLIELWLELRRR